MIISCQALSSLDAEMICQQSDVSRSSSLPVVSFFLGQAAQEVCKKLDSCREIANFLEEAAFQGFMFHRTAEDRLRMGQLQDKLSIARTWTAVLQETAAQAPKVELAAFILYFPGF